MRLEYEPLLRIQREIQGMPLGMERFRQYLRTIWNCYEVDFELLPLLYANPMGKDHVTARLETLLEIDADAIAADAVALASSHLADVPGEFKAAVVVADDLMGGWTNRYDYEFKIRFGKDRDRDRSGTPPDEPIQPPKWSKYLWVTGVLWSSEAATPQAVREAILTATYRFAYVLRHGPARTLRDMLAQEGQVMAAAGCTAPTLDDDEIAYTREVLSRCLDANDMRTCVECLFGDLAGRTLGFTPRGLGPWAGIALALDDAKRNIPAQI